MKDQIYPLLFKPGIQKDGTNFQGDYCTDGQWVRWQMGKIRKIGGVLGFVDLSTQDDKDEESFANSNMYIIPSINGQTLIYTSYGTQIKLYLKNIGAPVTINVNIDIDESLKNNYLVKFEQVIIATYKEDGSVAFDKESLLFMLFLPNSNINSNAKPFLYTRPLYSIQPDDNIDRSNLVQNGADGGMLYIAPYMFFYGSNGVLKYSKADKNKMFDPAKYTTINIGSGEKIIYAAAWRGNQSPTLVLWTTSSVIRIINIADQNATEPVFKIDPSMVTSSILSNRSVVQYDNVFEWVGTDGFYMYNGAVSKIENTMVFNYFYDNLNFGRRNQVFAILNKKYDEIWYFYPVKNSDSALNSKVIIHNHANSNNPKDWFWYSSDIWRQSGFYFNFEGAMYSFGPFFDYKPDSKGSKQINMFVWGHEINNVNDEVYDEVYIAQSGGFVQNNITSYFTTPTFSFASFSPLKQFVGADNFIRIKSFEPDFVYDASSSIDMTLEVWGRKYAMQELSLKSSHKIDKDIITKGKIDILSESRQMSLKFKSTKFFQFGNCFMKLGIGDGQ